MCFKYFKVYIICNSTLSHTADNCNMWLCNHTCTPTQWCHSWCYLGVSHLNVPATGLKVSTPRFWCQICHCQYFLLLLSLVLSLVSPQLEQLYSLSLCSKEDCVKILSRYQWNLQVASRYLIRWSRDDRSAPSERERPQISTERRVWSDFTFVNAGLLTFSEASCFTVTHFSSATVMCEQTWEVQCI